MSSDSNDDDVTVAGEDVSRWFAGALAGIAGLAATAFVILTSAPTSAAVAPSRPVPSATDARASGNDWSSSPSSKIVVPAAPAATSATAAIATSSSSCNPIVVPFAFGVSTMEASEKAAVDVLGEWLVRSDDAKGATVLIHGHADALGSDDGNLALSKARAQAVTARLAQLGVDRTRMTTRGFGAYQPVEGSVEEAASNRRVVIYVKQARNCTAIPNK